MTTGSWIPENEKTTLVLPGMEVLAVWAKLAEEDIAELDKPHLDLLSDTINAGVDQWQPHLAGEDVDTLRGLLKFFTLVEMAHPHLRADKHNPAIACAKLLRKGGNSLERELLQWIRDVSDNRFLPYGPL